jgi:hypothetical protein
LIIVLATPGFVAGQAHPCLAPETAPQTVKAFNEFARHCEARGGLAAAALQCCIPGDFIVPRR